MMSTTSASESPIGRLLVMDQVCLNTPSLFLVMHLIYEARNPDSFWKPYINVLSKTGTLLPLSYTLDELDKLQCSPTYEEVLRLIRATTKQYTYLFDRVKTYETQLNLTPPTWREFEWAVTVCMARQNRIPSSVAPGQYELCLIPGWDMCNYRDGELATFFNPETQASESFTMVDVKKGEQIYIYYGNRSNGELFIYSGFINDEHKADAIKIKLSLESNEKDSLFTMRKLFLTKRGLSLNSQVFKIKNEADFGDPNLMFYLRSAVMEKDDAAFALKNPNEKIWSNKCEKSALEVLEGVLSRTLEKYNIEESNSTNGRINLIKRLKVTEKNLLQNLITTISELKLSLA